MSSSTQRPIVRILTYAMLAVAAIATFFPLLWMFVLSVAHNPAGSATITELLRKGFTFDNYSDILSADSYGRYFANSVLVAVLVALGNCVLCLYTAYAFARLEFPFKRTLFTSVLLVLMLPAYVVMIPLYREIVVFGWINTYAALTVPFLVTPLGIFLLRQYIAELPRELEEAAILDGAGVMTVVHRIVFPLTRPALVVLFLYQFLNTWNAFLFPFLFTNTDKLRTLPVALTFFQGQQSIDIGHLMAGAGLSAIPVLLLFAVFQRKIIAGLTAGAVKG